MSDGDEPRTPGEWVRWFLQTDHEAVLYVRELATSVGAVLLVGLVLFGVSGVWPPMVAIESSSMEPHMQVGDLVFVMEEHRLAPEFAHAETGVVTYQVGEERGYTKFQAPGDVIIYRANGRGGTPIIHRARFWVDEGENWYDEADEDYVGGASNCEELPNCPAPHAGFITKGDNTRTNPTYDQVNGLSAPVRPSWIVGTAEARLPVLGYVKLCASGSGPCPIFYAGAPTVAAAPEAGDANATAVASRPSGGDVTTAADPSAGSSATVAGPEAAPTGATATPPRAA